MAMRSVVSRIEVCCLKEGNRRLSASGIRYLSDGTGRVFSDEERAKETIYVQKMEREKGEKMKKKTGEEKNVDKDKSVSDKKAEE